MKDEKKVKAAEEVKEEVQTEENGVELTEEELSSVAAGREQPVPEFEPPRKAAPIPDQPVK